ncbi:MAG: ribonuclease Y [Alphaproteobacteria bacterium]
MNESLIFVAIGTALVAGLAIGYFIRQLQLERKAKDRREEAERIVEQARTQAREIEKQARDDAQKQRSKLDQEVSRRRADMAREDERLQRRRDDLDKRADQVEQRSQALNKRQGAMDKRSNELEKYRAQIIGELESVSEMTKEEAKSRLIEEVEREARNDMVRIIRRVEEEAQIEGERKARELIADAIQRVASEHVSEITVSVVPLPSDEMKGRIIGRNGRNIRAFEQAAGVDVIVDDTPEAVTISCFDSVRREIARRSMERLVVDGRIHPANIEKIVGEVQTEVDKLIAKAGEEAAFDAGVHGLKPEVLQKLGRLKYRTSYGQNQLAHAIESSQLSAVMASELGADVELAKAGGLLHDIGKAMDHQVEGTHASIGAEFCQRHGVSEKVTSIIASHHREAEQESVEAVIVEAADAISGARPGARRESLEQYIKRVRALEDIANSFKGVSESYALQAGREIRVIVTPEDIDDLDSLRLARDVAKKIEEGMSYPGQIKVTVIRETRAIDFAK